MSSVSVRAVIIHRKKLLLLRRNRPGGVEYFVTPGGRVEQGEKHILALKRECLEELGVHVRVGKKVGSYVARFSDGNRTQLYFLCTITGGKVGSGTGLEHQPGGGYSGTYTPEWVPQKKVAALPFRPKRVLRMLIRQFSDRSSFRENSTRFRCTRPQHKS